MLAVFSLLPLLGLSKAMESLEHLRSPLLGSRTVSGGMEWCSKSRPVLMTGMDSKALSCSVRNSLRNYLLPSFDVSTFRLRVADRWGIYALFFAAELWWHSSSLLKLAESSELKDLTFCTTRSSCYIFICSSG